MRKFFCVKNLKVEDSQNNQLETYMFFFYTEYIYFLPENLTQLSFKFCAATRSSLCRTTAICARETHEENGLG